MVVINTGETIKRTSVLERVDWSLLLSAIGNQSRLAEGEVNRRGEWCTFHVLRSHTGQNLDGCLRTVSCRRHPGTVRLLVLGKFSKQKKRDHLMSPSYRTRVLFPEGLGSSAEVRVCPATVQAFLSRAGILFLICICTRGHLMRTVFGKQPL